MLLCPFVEKWQKDNNTPTLYYLYNLDKNKDIWNIKYGQELKSIKLQILFYINKRRKNKQSKIRK